MIEPIRIRRALTRAIPDTFSQAVVQTAPNEPIQIELARRQHRAYVEALRSLGLTVAVLPAAPEFPDCCFIEDCAVYADGVALITRLGTPSRRGEETAVAEAIGPHARLEYVTSPATLEGGDCLRIGKRWYVGRSERTNADGVRRVRDVFGPLGFDIVEVPVCKFLHLKCCCSYLGDGWLLLAGGSIPPDVFRDVRIVPVPADEAYAANCVSVNGTVLVPAGYPVTRRAIEAVGLRTLELDTSEIRKADGALTCMSLLL